MREEIQKISMQTIEGKSKFLRKGKRNAINSMLMTSKKECMYN